MYGLSFSLFFKSGYMSCPYLSICKRRQTSAACDADMPKSRIKEKLKMNKVLGTENPADMNTKGLSGDEIAKYVEMLSMGYKEGRANLAPEVHNLIKKVKCTRFNSSTSKVTHRVRVKSNQQSLQDPQSNQLCCDCGCKDCWLYCAYNERS